MLEFLTLAITETTSNTENSEDFYVIAMETKNQQIVSFALSKEYIVSPTGEIFWDLGFSTIVNQIPQRKYINNDNSPFIINGEVKLHENNIELLKKILDAKSVSGANFFDNEKLKFGILKVSKIIDISYRFDNGINNKTIKHYLSVNVNGISEHKNPIILLNKDYRWIHFWNRIYNSSDYDDYDDYDDYNDKKNKYLKLFNRKDKNLFLILYRHKFKTDVNVNYWIAGMHWL